ncbi:MAG: DNRLRE domain-containing protein, partial [Acidobacteriota bacterium]
MKSRAKKIIRLLGVLFVAALVAGVARQPLSAQVQIPQGSTVNSAVFWVYVSTPDSRPVTLHRITAEWAETVVTYNGFGNSFDPNPIGGFTADAVGWKSVDVTSLVQAWVFGPLAGGFNNYGIAMVEMQDSGSEVLAIYLSSDYWDPAYRPKLVIQYTPPGGSLTTVTIQRPGSPAEQVLDTYITALTPDANYGTSIELITRNLNGLLKYSLLRFIFTVPQEPCPGTGTPGYWMNHPEAWPEDTIVIGGVVYNKFDAIELMKMAVAGDKTYTM